MNENLINLLEHSPYIFIIVILMGAIAILWKEYKAKEKKIYDLSDTIIKIASLYESKSDRIEEQNEKHNEQHALIIELLKDTLRILKG